MKKTALLFMTLCLAVLALFSAGCKKDSGWKAQSSPKQSTGAAASSNEPVQDNRPTSVGVGSFLHNLFGTELPANTDRYHLPSVEKETEFIFDNTIHDADVYGNIMYFVEHKVSRIYAFDFSTGDRWIFTEEIKNPSNICTDEDGVYVADADTNEIVWFSFDGKRAGAVDLPEKMYAHVGSGDRFEWMLERYIASLQHYDGLLLVATRDAVWTILDGEREWNRAAYHFETKERVISGDIVNRKQIVIHTERKERITYIRVTLMDRSGDNQILLRDDFTNRVLASEGKMYVFPSVNQATRMYEISTGEEIFIQNIEKGNPVVRVAVSNGTLFALWVGNKVSLIPMPNDWNTVKIISPESEHDRLEEIADGASSVGVQFKTYSNNAFFDKVSAELLSGKAEFDIALVTGTEEQVTTLLRAIMQNGQYVNLYQSDRFKSNMDEAYPGVKELMELNGKMVALPLEFSDYWYGFSDLAQNCGITLPSVMWDLSDLETYAAELADSGQKYALFSNRAWQKTSIVLSLAISTVQASVDVLRDETGREAETAIYDLFEKLDTYRSAGLLYGDNDMFGASGRGLDFITPNGANSLFSLPPTAEKRVSPRGVQTVFATKGKNPVQPIVFLFVNPNSERIEQALSLLADLTGEDNRYNYKIFKSPLFPGLTKYYVNETITVDPTTGLPTLNPHREQIVQEENNVYIQRLDEFLGTWYTGSELCLIGTTDRARNAVSDFCTGKMTGEDCAQILYEEFVYRIKG